MQPRHIWDMVVQITPTSAPLAGFEPTSNSMEEFLNPMGFTQRKLADAIHVTYQRVNDIVNGRRSVTPSIALRFGKFFNTSAFFWMNLQVHWDMYFAQQDEMEFLKTTKRI